MRSPGRKRGVSVVSSWTEGFQSGEQQGAVGGDDQHWLAGDGVGVPDLGLPDTQGVFFFAVVDFDLPAIQIELNEFARWGFEVGGQKISRLTIVELGAFALSIGSRSDDDQTQGAPSSASLPEHIVKLFEAHLAAFSSICQSNAHPRDA